MKYTKCFIIIGVLLAIISCQLDERHPEPEFMGIETDMTRASASGFRGTNMPAVWWQSDSLGAYGAVKSNGFNAVRIVWETKGSAGDLSNHISTARNAGLSVVVELHDVTGSDSTSELSRMADYWCRSDVKAVLSQYSDIMVNIANEWGSFNLSDATWYDAYKSAIQKMRNAGIKNTIVVDASGWGQNESPIINYGKSIIGVDSNVILDLHMYGSWNDPAKIRDKLSQIKSLGLPLMVGEFGYNYNNGGNNLSCQVDAATVMSACVSNGFGYLAWSWCGNNSENAWLDMTNDYKTLNSWGNLVKSGGSSSATSPPGTTNPPTTPPSSGGSGNIIVRARGTEGTEIIELRVNGSAVASWTLTTSMQDYSANGSGSIQVAFTNDSGGRDVQIDYIKVDGTTYQAENQSINTGVWQDGSCGGSNSEWLHCNGYIDFGGGSSSSTSPPSITNPPSATNPPASTNPPGSGGSCGTCNWYGTEYPMCCTDVGGWGWENNKSCISQSTCDSQNGDGSRSTSPPTSPPSSTTPPTSPPSVTNPPATTNPPTAPPSSGGSTGSTCSSGTSISSGFSKDGAGEFCFEASSVNNYINSWNLDELTVNGVGFTNTYAGSSNLPAKIDGKYYIYYKCSVSWGHFELK